MKALITGGSSGIGKAIAYKLASLNIDVVLVARRENELKNICDDITNKYHVNAKYYVADITDFDKMDNIIEQNKDIEVFINNAGKGIVGNFTDIDFNKDDEIIDLNIKAMHYLFKRYLNIFIYNNKGYILNVSSIASFQPGPKMATYYASKAYVTNLSLAVSHELKKQKKNVYVSALCPGPTRSEFNKVANAKFNLKEQDASIVANKAIKGLFKKKQIIIPSFKLKAGIFFERFISTRLILNIIYKSQCKKEG